MSALASLALLGCPPVVERTPGAAGLRVTRVADGDTLTVEGGVRVRVAFIDCPERDQPFGPEAGAFLAAQTKGARVRLMRHDEDRYGRVVAEVFVGERNLGRALVEAGLCWHYRRHSKDPELERLERAAKAAKRGLWSRASPVPPWRHRARQRDARR